MWADSPRPSHFSERRDLPGRVAVAGVAFVTAILGVPFARVPWPRIDLYNTLQQAEDLTWPETIRTAFTNASDFRPLMTIATKLAYEAAGLHLWFYKALILAQFAALLWVLLVLWRPSGWKRISAAVVAMACFVGLHTSRVLFLFLPLNGGSVVMTLLACAAIIVIEPAGRRIEWWLLPLTLFSLLLLEFGVLVVPVVVVAWWLSAPGVTWRGVVAVFAGATLYFVTRHLIGAPVGELWATESGLGFDDVPPQQLQGLFEHAPWLFWGYNVASSLLTVLVSEPRAGKFKFVSALLRGASAHWQWLHVVSSLITSVLIGGVLVTVRNVSPRDRTLAAIGIVLLLGGSALGFLYTRDRIGMPAGLGYGLVLYVALSLFLERASATPIKRVLAVVVVSAIGVCWAWRSAEAGLQLRDRAWEYYLEWTVRYRHESPETPLFQTLRESVIAHRPPNPRRDPEWTHEWFERGFDRIRASE